ncbi:MAG: CDGSH iron-sulfur domain-containing protein [Anaerolineae bacterium]|nr:CDGSH iron-sulfur domain-containing protein [Anaerolineae bacterium]
MADFEVKGRENGPYLIKGQAGYVDADGVEQQTAGKMVALCRCGGSKNKPFCDGTHRALEFQAPPVELAFTMDD